MRGNNNVRRLPQPTRLGQRLRDKHIQRGAADLAGLESIHQRVLVDGGAAADVDDPGVLGQQLEALGVEGVLGGVGAGQDHDEGVGLGEQLGELVLAVDLDAVAHALAAGDALDLGAEAAQVRGERLCDVAEAPDEDAGVAQGGEGAGGAVGLGPAEVAGPLVLELVVAHLVEAAGGVEEEAEGVLGDGVVVEAGAGGDGDLGGVEAGVEDVVRAGGEGLDPLEVLEAASGVLEVVGGVGPGHEDLGVGVLLGDGRLDVVRDELHGEALQGLDVELKGSRVEELHGGGGIWGWV